MDSRNRRFAKFRKVEASTSTEGESVTPSVASLTSMPEEVLQKIFFELDDPADIMTVAGTRPQFRRILAPKIPVASIIGVFPQIYSKLDGEDILNCRLVCKKWKKAVDEHLQIIPYAKIFTPYPCHPTASREPDKRLHFTTFRQPPPYALQYQPTLRQKQLGSPYLGTLEDVQALALQIENHPGNPFLLRYLDLENVTEDELEEELYWEPILQLLSSFGGYVHRMYLSPRRLHTDGYIITQKVIERAPNLKRLVIAGFQEIAPINNENNYRLWQTCIENNPLPALPHLETLECNLPLNFKMQLVVDEFMIRYSFQLKRLSISVSALKLKKEHYRQLPSLKDLSLLLDQPTELCCKVLRSINALQLGKLTLQIFSKLEIRRVLGSVNRHLKTVAYLKLAFNMPTNDKYFCGPATFALENVKTLEVTESEDAPYDLLVSHMPFLENILICCRPGMCRRDSGESAVAQHCPDGEFEIRKGLYYSGVVYQSNLWSKLKSLKEFTIGWLGGEIDLAHEIVETSKYTRERYEYLCKNKPFSSEVAPRRN